MKNQNKFIPFIINSLKDILIIKARKLLKIKSLTLSMIQKYLCKTLKITSKNNNGKYFKEGYVSG